MSRDPRLDELEAKLAYLSDEVTRLRSERRRTMAQTFRCPSCSGKRILHFTSVQDMTRGGTVPMSLNKQMVGFWMELLNTGLLEAFACRDCRLVEWRVISLDDVTPDGKSIVECVPLGDEDAPSGPYR